MTALSILVVDPSPELWTKAGRWLEPHFTALVQCGAEAFAALALLRFDVIILDPGLPDLGGNSVLRRIRQAQPWARTIALSGCGHTTTACADATLARPVGEAQLLRAVAFAIEPREPQLN